MYLKYAFLILFSSTLRAETYQAYVQRIDANKYTTKGGESVQEVLQKKGYHKLQGHFGDINHTKWKNGLDANNVSVLPAGIDLRLPYIPPVVVKKVVKAKRSLKKRAIASVNTEAPKAEASEDLSALSLSFTESFLSIESKDNSGQKANFASKTSQKIGLSFLQFWNNSNITTSYRLSQHSVELDTPANKTLSKNKFNISNFGFGVDKKMENNWSYGGAIDYNTVIYASASTGNNIKLQGTQLGEVSARVGKQLAEYKKLKFKAELKGLAVIPRNAPDTKFRSGWGAEPSLQSIYRHKNVALAADMFYKYRVVKREVSTDKQTDIGITFSLTYYWD